MYESLIVRGYTFVALVMNITFEKSEKWEKSHKFEKYD